jgi:repressor LexA
MKRAVVQKHLSQCTEGQYIQAMSETLTARQNEVLEFIRARMQEFHRPPTVREIGEHFQIRSTNGVRAILLALERKGSLQRSPRLSRGLMPVGMDEAQDRAPGHSGEDWLEVPVLGRAAAGSPILAQETTDEMLRIPRPAIPRGTPCFALKVRGESMREAGIMDGDFVIAAKSEVARNGDTIVALLGEEATIKTYHSEKGQVELRPENRDFKPIVVNARSEEFRVLGKVVAVWRTYAF